MGRDRLEDGVRFGFKHFGQGYVLAVDHWKSLCNIGATKLEVAKKRRSACPRMP